jgi:hypothetical protein
MVSMKKLMLGAAVLAGALGLGAGANKAQAAEVRVYVHGGPVAYVPPCPGPGYVWVGGRWSFVGIRRPAPIVRYDYRFGYDRRYFDRWHR